MPIVAEILAKKGSQVLTIAPTATVLEAIIRMNQHKVGALVVISEGRIAGIFTERDVLRRVMAEMHSPAELRVSQVMTEDVTCCTPDTDVEEASRIMAEKRVRHLPVCEETRLVGMLSIADLNSFFVGMHERTINYLTDYIYGRA